jgi:hypothetical protein
MLGRFSSKVGSLLDELADVLGAFEGIPVAQEGQHMFPILHRKAVADCCNISCVAQAFRWIISVDDSCIQLACIWQPSVSPCFGVHSAILS